MRVRLLHRGSIDERTGGHTRRIAGAHLQCFDGLAKPAGEFVVNPVLDEDPVCADACLAGIAKLACHRTCNRDVEIGVVEHNQRSIAAELEAQLLDGVGTLPHQHDPTRVEPVKESFRTVGLLVSSDPMAWGRPVTMLNTPAEIPASSASFTSASAL